MNPTTMKPRTSSGPDVVDLSGEWRCVAEAEPVSDPADLRGDRGVAVRLPGALAEQGIGSEPGPETPWVGDIRESFYRDPTYARYRVAGSYKPPFWLTPRRVFRGVAWLRRELVIPASWAGARVVLHLERPHWATAVWVDGVPAGSCDRLGVPHVHDLGTALEPGQHELVVRVDNREVVPIGPNSHSITDHTQGNWIGVVGKVEVRATPSAAWIEGLTAWPSAAERAVTVEVRLAGGGVAAAGVTTEVFDPEGRSVGRLAGGAGEGGVASHWHELGRDAPLWDEFRPDLHRVEVTVEADGRVERRELRIGLRDVSIEGTRVVVNGRRRFLRGTLDCAAFPLTGHPPVDVPAWRKVFAAVKAHGLNHVRFHSWCPPAAAFDAADEAGVYLQVECSAWPNQGVRLGSGEPVDAWLTEEAEAIVREHGHRPSFLILASSNEPDGPHHREWLAAWVAAWRRRDRRRLVTTAAGWPVLPGSDVHVAVEPRSHQWGDGVGGLMNAERPSTEHDWRAWVEAHPDAPTVSHEIGQWCVHPDFAEVAKYTGLMEPRNLEVFRDLAEAGGVLADAGAFVEASGRLQVACTKADIEAALRTPGFGGFQLLGLQDFPGQGTALVGVLDVFYEPKRYVAADEYRGFAGAVVPLVRLKRFTGVAGEVLRAVVELSQFGEGEVVGPVVWRLAFAGGAVVAAGQLASGVRFPSGDLHRVGEVVLTLPGAGPAELVLEVSVPAAGATNRWPVFVFPEPQPGVEVPEGVRFVRALDREVWAWMEGGGRLVWIPEAADVLPDPVHGRIVAGYSTVFWNQLWTDNQPPHTLGLRVRADHPALAGFPTRGHTDVQWWDILRRAVPARLGPRAAWTPVVQVIDDATRARRLALVAEARVGGGALLLCTADLLWERAARPEAAALLKSLVAYAGSGRCVPEGVVTREELAEAFVLVAEGAA